MTTAALGAEQFYGNETNKNRCEGLEQARALDLKTLNQWLGHPHLEVIDNNQINFKEKVNRVITKISNLVGKPYTLINRKFLVKSITNLNALKQRFQCVLYRDTITFIQASHEKESVSIYQREYANQVKPVFIQVTRQYKDCLKDVD